MASIELTKRIAERLNKSDAKNIQAQANARYILYSVRENEANFPRFNPKLTEKAHQQAYLCLEAACSFYSEGIINEAFLFFERGAELLEHNNVTGVHEDANTNFSRMVGSLAYYCACQYSKAFILLKDRSFESPVASLLWRFLTRNIDALEEECKKVLLSPTKEEYDAVYAILLARAMSFTINYYYYGEKAYLVEAIECVKDATALALLGDEPAIWWLFRLVRILLEGIIKSSLWSNLGENPSYKVDDLGWIEAFAQIGIDYRPVFDNTAKIKMRQYINALSFSKHPVTELFLSQRKAMEKVLGMEGAVVSMPTSSGKTRIAELVILQTLMYDSSSKILYIAPYRSLSYEMEETLSATFNPMEYYVTHLYGTAQFTSIDRQEMEQARVVIATPEKAKAILRANDEMVKEIRLVVMDEGHLLGDEPRKVANEMFSEELKRIVYHNHGRFLVLSAVLPNAKDMSVWLANGEEHVVKDTWRPSSQRFGKMLCYKSRLDIEWIGETSCFNPSFVRTEVKADKKVLIAKAALKLSSLGAILLYCPTTGQVLSNARVMLGLLQDGVDWGEDPDWIRFNLVCNECEEDSIYLELAQKGILCHSAALKTDVRRYTERLLRKGKARFIYATNTLAQGVNLGVSTVIVLGTFISPGTYLTKQDFWNMAGRAGRSFVDTEGKILFVCDCKDAETERKSNWVANSYMNSNAIERVESGVFHYLHKLKEIQNTLGIDFETLLQLITENNLNDIDGATQFFELIDDSLFSLDLAYREDENDDVAWVEEHFRHSLAVIQEANKNEQNKNIAMLKSRVKAVRSMTHGNPVPQAFASSGLPLNVALHFEEHTDLLNSLVDEYLQSDKSVEAKIHFISLFDHFVAEIPTSRLILYDMNVLEQIRSHWVKGEPLAAKLMADAEKYYGYTFTWLMNALAARNAMMEEESYKSFYEEISLIAQYGLPSKWAVQIYLSGISSRKVAAELASKLEEPNYISRLSYVARFLKTVAADIQRSDAFSQSAKDWMAAISKRPGEKQTIIPSLHQFNISGEGTDRQYDRLLCKKYNEELYLCSVDMKYLFIVHDQEGMPFSQVADIPGVFFSWKGDGWSMECHNPYVNIQYQ